MQPSVRRHDLQGVEPLGREPGHVVRPDAGHGERPGRWLHLEESVIGGLFGSRQRVCHGVALRVRSRDRLANLLPPSNRNLMVVVAMSGQTRRATSCTTNFGIWRSSARPDTTSTDWTAKPYTKTRKGIARRNHDFLMRHFPASTRSLLPSRPLPPAALVRPAGPALALPCVLVRARRPQGHAEPRPAPPCARGARPSRRPRPHGRAGNRNQARDRRTARRQRLSIARTYGPVVARVNEPPCGPVDGLLSPLGLRVNHLLSVEQGPVG